MKFVSFEDNTGICETVLFPKVYNRFCHMLNEMRPYLLKGKVEQDFTAVTLTVRWIEFLDRRSQGLLPRSRHTKAESPVFRPVGIRFLSQIHRLIQGSL
jgi:DNA polymerase III alpha subunit